MYTFDIVGKFGVGVIDLQTIERVLAGYILAVTLGWWIETRVIDIFPESVTFHSVIFWTAFLLVPLLLGLVSLATNFLYRSNRLSALVGVVALGATLIVVVSLYATTVQLNEGGLIVAPLISYAVGIFLSVVVLVEAGVSGYLGRTATTAA